LFNNYMIPLRGVFAMEFRGPKALENPLADITNRRVVKKLPDPLTIAERDAILGSMRKRYDIRVWAYFAFAFFTGMRPEEIIALRWEDIDWNAATARVQRVRTFMGSEREGSKTHTVRDVDLVPPALDALKAMKPYTAMKRDTEGREVDIFENPVTGRPWHDERSQREHYWIPTLKLLGVRRRRPYCTRHTYCTVALMRGIKPGYIAAQAGHSVKMLLDTYARWIPENDGGSERQRLAAAMTGQEIPLESPQALASGQQKTPSSEEKTGPDVGRRDWTRTSAAGEPKGTKGRAA
jgi:integrase